MLVWFSCGAASAIAAKLAADKYRNDNIEILYCDTLKHESDDNPRFMADVSEWIGIPIKVVATKNQRYIDENGRADIDLVWKDRRFMAGPRGAPCTNELKRQVRRDYQLPGDLHIFGLTADETAPIQTNPQKDRIRKLESQNPDIDIEWNLRDAGILKSDCYRILKEAGIQLPMLYRQGFTNNNCIGCVKGGAGYWNKVRALYPDRFSEMAKLSRQIGARLVRVSLQGKPTNIFLDELNPKSGNYGMEPDMDCGPQCVMPE